MDATNWLCDVGRGILSGSKYPILSTRLLKPEAYLYPASSLEAKKALLLSLSPMLSDAEEQRQKETSACESFTRCKSGKGKGKFACYEYTDVDVKCTVDFAEYEKRYIMYINSNKKTYAKDTPLSPSLNYITLQHRQRTKSERNIQLPKRNLNSILKGQLNDENLPQRGMSPSSTATSTSKSLNKPKIEPVKLDDSTVELVAALLKPSRSTSRTKGNLTAAIAAASPENAAFYRAVTSPPLVATVATALFDKDVIRSPFENLCSDKRLASPLRPSKPPVPASPSDFVGDTIPAPSPQTETPAEDVSMDISSDEVDWDCDADQQMDLEQSGGNDRKRKHGRGGRSRLMARRGTLSPASVRAMLEEACATENDGVSSNVLLGFTNTDTGDADQDDMCVSYTLSTEHSYIIRSPEKTFSSAGESKHRGAGGEDVEVPEYGVPEYEVQSDADRSESPHDTEHTKKYARSGSPSMATFLSSVEVTSVTSSVVVTEESTVFQAPNGTPDTGMDSEHVLFEQSTVCEQGVEEQITIQVLQVPEECLNTESSVPVAAHFSYERNSVSMGYAIAVPGHQEIHDEAAFTESAEMSDNVTQEEAQEVIQEDSRTIIEMSETDMDVIEDFGRELDNILCDVSSLGYSSPEELSSPEESPTADSQLETVNNFACASLERPTPASPLSDGEPEVSQIDATPMSPPSPDACTEPAECTSPKRMVDCVDHAQESPAKTSTQEVTRVYENSVASSTEKHSGAHNANHEEMPDLDEHLSSPQDQQQQEFASSPAAHNNIFTSLTKVLMSPASAASTPGNDLYSYLDANRPLMPPTPPSIPRRSAPSPKVGQFSPMMRSNLSSKASSPVGAGDVSVNMSMDESQIMFCDHDADLEDFQMLESMVEKEFESGDLSWDFGLPTAQAPVDHAAAPKPNVASQEFAHHAETPLEAVSADSVIQTHIEQVSSPAPVSNSMTPLRSPEPSTLNSGERRRRGLSSIPRYASTTPQHGNVLATSGRTASPLPAPSSAQKVATEVELTVPVEADHSPSNGSRAKVTMESMADFAVAVVASTTRASQDWPEELIDISAVEAQARARYLERVEMARWQCEWDIVSAHTANAAIKKYSGRSW